MKTHLYNIYRLVAGAVISMLLLTGCTPVAIKPASNLNEARDLVVERIFEKGMGERALFASPELKQSGVMIGTWPTPEKTKVAKDSWFFFVDDAPGANWEHPARFILVEKGSGKIKSIPVTTPPRELLEMKAMNPAAEIELKILRRNIDSIRDVAIERPVTLFKRNKYAVLMSGGWDAGANHSRYWNDLAFIYKALKEKYNYTDSEIIVLFANGTHSPDEDLDGDGTDDIDYAASKSNLTTVMQNVGAFISENGKFFFYSTNHGGYESGHDAYLYLWGETIRDDEFATLSKKIKSKHAIYVMEQCYSGGMMDDILTAQKYPCNNPRVCVMTAAKHDEVSYSADTEGSYDEYVYHWTSAVYGRTPAGTIVNADSNGDGQVSMKEAHEYAKANDSRSEHPLIGSCISSACDTTL